MNTSAEMASRTFDQYVLISTLIVWLRFSSILAANYLIALRNEEIFSSCPGDEEYEITKAMDFSNITFNFVSDDTIHIAGTFTPIWDSDPSDKLMVEGSLFKWSGGQWMPTPLSMKRSNMCAALYKPHEFWYDTFLRYVYEEDRVCVTHKGAVLRVNPFNATLIFRNVPAPPVLSGYYKIKFSFNLFDKHGMLKTDRVCSEIHGDVYPLE